MFVDELLRRLEDVNKSGRGWKAKCPAHADNDPSLSIREGDKGILLKCWAGCDFNAICKALGITLRQLFFDDAGPLDRHAIHRRQTKRHAARIRQRAKGRRADARREAEAVIRAATGVDISGWSDQQLDVALNRVCDASELLEREDTVATEPESASV